MQSAENSVRLAAQSAVFFSCLMLEAAANCCLLDLGFSRSLRDDFDKLPTLVKFDLYLAVKKRGRVSLDRGSQIYREARELKKIRDLTVHPKQTRVSWMLDDEGAGSGRANQTEVLGLSYSMAEWTSESALTAFRSANGFLNYFFRDICKANSRELRLMLFSPHGGDWTDVSVVNDVLKTLSRRYSIPLLYVGVR